MLGLRPFASLSPFGSLSPALSDAYQPQTLREAVYQRLSKDAAIAELAGPRIFPVGLPQECELPALTFYQASSTEPRILAGHTRYRSSRFRVSAWANDQDAAEKLIRAVRARLVDFRGTVGTVFLGAVGVQGEYDQAEKPNGGEDEYTYQIILELIITYKGLI